jgi:hypothetical protein
MSAGEIGGLYQSGYDRGFNAAQSAAAGTVLKLNAEIAALLATRQRYEAALRRVAAKGCIHPTPCVELYRREVWCGPCEAEASLREALAAAQEGAGQLEQSNDKEEPE